MWSDQGSADYGYFHPVGRHVIRVSHTVLPLVPNAFYSAVELHVIAMNYSFPGSGLCSVKVHRVVLPAVHVSHVLSFNHLRTLKRQSPVVPKWTF